MGVLQNMMKKMEHKTNNIEREIESLKQKKYTNFYIDLQVNVCNYYCC